MLGKTLNKMLVLAAVLAPACGVAQLAGSSGYTDEATTVYAAAGAGPGSALIQASDGRFYGTTSEAIYGYAEYPEFGYTTTPTVLHTAAGGSDLGGYSALVQGQDGALYGTAPTGGANGQGQVFRVDLEGNFSALYSFCSLANCADGAAPVAALIVGTDGNFYGTTAGIPYEETIGPVGGTVFRLTPAGVLTTLHSFCTGAGCNAGPPPGPVGPLVQASDGNFYGIAGPSGFSIFQVTPQGQFRALPICAAAGNCPYAGAGAGGLVEGPGQLLYGYVNGVAQGFGSSTAFSFSSAGVFTPLFTFCEAVDGSSCPVNVGFDPSGPLWVGGDGNVYGTTEFGGASAYGGIYSMTQQAQVFSFSQPGNLASPVNGILEDQNGILYGVAAAGGDGYGGIYAVAFADPGLAPAIQLSPADANVLVGQPVEFTWRVNNAYSATMQQCVARVNNQTISAVPLSGTYTYVPPASGTYRVAITCGGAETAYSDVDVTAAKTPTQTGMFIGFGPGSFIQTSPYVSKLGNTTYGQPTGSVGLALNGRVFASVALPLPATQGDAYINGGIPSGLPNGTYTLAAEYSGDAGDLPSSSTPIPLTVNGSTVGVFAYSGAGVDSSTGEAYASLGYAVLNTSTSAPDPTGTVAFSLRGNTFATVPLGGGAEGPVGFCSITGSIPPGTYDIAATYSGDANNPPVSTTQTVVVP